jgi:hypothetical protein
MRIGYCVEGSTDKAMLYGLKERWCPTVQLIEARFRGTRFRRRDIPAVCLDLIAGKAVDLAIFLRDANEEKWRDVLAADEGACKPEYKPLAIFGVCDRNVECWLCADPNWIAKETGHQPNEFRVPDPKGAFEKAMQITGLDRKEQEIAKLVKQAPLKKWLSNNRSFKEFYERIWDKSKEQGCKIENLQES